MILFVYVQILHRRLGARNVLLKMKTGTLHAKITGFGPLKGEAEEAGGNVKVSQFQHNYKLKYI